MKILLAILLTIVLAVPVMAGDTVVDLHVWPGLAPNETTSTTGDSTVDPHSGTTTVTNITSPHIHVFIIPDGKLHPTVVVFPGGGYKDLAIENEGTQIAEWLNKLGYDAAVLYYRVPDNRDGAYQDAQRTLSVLRARSSEFGIDPNHLGVMGFSAGGHLAARLSAGFETRSYPLVDTQDAQSCRPDFTALIYPAYLVDSASGAVEPEVIPVWNQPPTFLVQTKDDPYFDIIPYSIAFVSEALPVKTLAYDGGGHGYGLHASSDQPVSAWPKEAAAWLAQQVSTSATSKP